MYYFVAGEKMNDWYTSLFLGIMALASGLPLAMGWKKPVLPEIHLNSEKMEWKRNAWNSSFQWDKLDRVEFNDRKLKDNLCNDRFFRQPENSLFNRR